MKNKWMLPVILGLILVLIALICVCIFIEKKDRPEGTVPGTSEQTKPSQSVTTAPSTEPIQSTAPSETTAPPTTQAPTQPQLQNRNPFTGVSQDEPFTARPFLISINNNKNAMPMCGLLEADIVFEMLVNSYSTRCLALVTDVNAIERIGAIRSLRFNFIDLAQAYDGIVVYASGSRIVLTDLKEAGVDHVNALSGNNGGAFYREPGRLASGYAKEHTLFTIPALMAQYAQKLGYSITADAQKDYGFRFAEDGTPVGGETANTITMSFFTRNKKTTMYYDAATQLYQYHQYGQNMVDGNTNEPLTFRNVFTLFAVNNNVDVYHIADLLGSGDGYYACGGKIVPIKWYREEDSDPFTFTLADGTPLEQGVGNSYVGIIPVGSAFTYQ